MQDEQDCEKRRIIMKKICKQCGKEFEVFINYPSDRIRKTCSKKCRYLSMKKNLKGKNKRFGKDNHMFGKKLSQKTKRKMSDKKRGKTWEEIYGIEYAQKKKKLLSKIARNRIWTQEQKDKIRQKRKGFKPSKKSIEKMRQTILKQYKDGRQPTRIYGQIPWNKNKINPYSEDTKRKMSKSQKLRFSNPIVLSKHAEEQKRRFKNDKFLFNFFKGKYLIGFEKENYKLTNLDKKVIKAKILIHKIRRSLNV